MTQTFITSFRIRWYSVGKQTVGQNWSTNSQICAAGITLTWPMSPCAKLKVGDSQQGDRTCHMYFIRSGSCRVQCRWPWVCLLLISFSWLSPCPMALGEREWFFRRLQLIAKPWSFLLCFHPNEVVVFRSIITSIAVWRTFLSFFRRIFSLR